MVPREFVTLLLLVSLAGSSPIDFDLAGAETSAAGGGGDYELLMHQQNSAGAALLAPGDDNNLDDLTGKTYRFYLNYYEYTRARDNEFIDAVSKSADTV